VQGEIEALWISARSTTQAMPDDAQELLNRLRSVRLFTALDRSAAGDGPRPNGDLVMSASDRTDVYSRITAEIVSTVENGAGEWRMPWHHDGNSITRPRNVTSDKGYRGINVLALWAAARRGGYASGIWGTYQQWSQLGGRVRRGEKATTVVFWKQIENRQSRR
jgi:hypothetical protein